MGDGSWLLLCDTSEIVHRRAPGRVPLPDSTNPLHLIHVLFIAVVMQPHSPHLKLSTAAFLAACGCPAMMESTCTPSYMSSLGVITAGTELLAVCLMCPVLGEATQHRR